MRLGKVSDEKAEWYNTEVKDIMDLSGKKTAFLSHLYTKMLILPKQARDKHSENSKKDRFLAGRNPWRPIKKGYSFMDAAMQLGTGIYRLPLLDGNEKTLCLLSQSSLMVRKTHTHLFSDAI